MNRDFLMSDAQHHVRHQSPPMIWQDGFPLGNGFMGAMVWGDGHPLNFTLDCADLWDNRRETDAYDNPDYNYANLCRLIENKKFDQAQKIFGAGVKSNGLYPTKLSIGRIELDIGAGRAYECRLDLDRAVVEGRLTARTARHNLTAFIAKNRHVLCVRVTNMPKHARVKLRPLSEICPAMAGLGYPSPEYKPGIMAQTLPEGLCYAVAWNDAGDDRFIAVETGPTSVAAADQAAATLSAAMRAGFDKLYREHTAAWRQFWGASSVVLPEPAAEFYWYYGVYLLASSARRGHMPPGLQGLWAMDGMLPPWRGCYVNDMNVQETFWPAGMSGHIDLLDCWCDYMLKRLPAVRQFTRRVFGTEGTFWPASLYGNAEVTCGGSSWFAVSWGWSHGGWLGWLVWLRWRYSLDQAWLRQTGYPILSEIFLFFRANLAQASDGYLHVPLSCSPEYHGHNAVEAFCRDPNIDLALIRKCGDWIVEMEQALGINELSGDARRMRARLAPYALSDKNQLCLWPGKPLDESHRHPSSLMAIHPAMDLTIDGDDPAQKIISASVLQFLELGQSHWAGHTYAQLISMAAVLKCSGWAYDCLRQFMEHWTMPNGLHVNADWRASGASALAPMFGANKYRERTHAPFTMESNNAVSAGIGDMLAQGWGDKVRVFPAVPEHWRAAAFFELRTEGGWKVSAVRQNGQTVWVRITATVTRRLELENPFNGTGPAAGNKIAWFKRGAYHVKLKAGESLILCRHDYRFDRRTVINNIRSSGGSLLGLAPSGRAGDSLKAKIAIRKSIGR